jgi:hypothetical protein
LRRTFVAAAAPFLRPVATARPAERFIDDFLPAGFLFEPAFEPDLDFDFDLDLARPAGLFALIFAMPSPFWGRCSYPIQPTGREICGNSRQAARQFP